MADTGRRVAACDLGSNSVKLVVAEVVDGAAGAPPGLRRVADGLALTRIGRRVGATGRLDPEAERRTLSALAEFAAKAQALAAGPMRCVATAGLRDAARQESARFVARAEAEAGVAIEVIDGMREAHLTSLAVVRSLPQVGPDFRMVDVGGRSTEVVQVRGGRADPQETVSIRLGGVGLTEDILTSVPPTAAELAEARRYARQSLSSARTGPDLDGRPVVAAGGTATTIAVVLHSIDPYDADRIHGIRIPLARLSAGIERLSRLSPAELLALPGLPPGRADIAVGGAVALEAAALRLRAHELTVSDRGLAWGLAYELAAGA